MRLFFFSFGLFVMTSAVMSQEQTKPPQVLDDIFRADSFWSLDRDSFLQKPEFAEFFWTSTNKESAQCTGGCTFLKEPVVKTVLRFGSNTVSEVMISLCSHGTSGSVSEADFLKKLAAIESKMKALAGNPVKQVVPKDGNSSEHKAKVTLWTKGAFAYKVEQGYTALRDKSSSKRVLQGEFVNLTILKNDKKIELNLVSDAKPEVSSLPLGKRVKKTEEEIIIDSVPMVTEGANEPYVVAATERVLRYYGMEVNSLELTQQAFKNAKNGPVSGTAAVNSMVSSMGLKMKTLMQLTANDYAKIVSEYNIDAKRKRLPSVTLVENGSIPVGKIMKAMNKDIFLENRQRNKKDIGLFERTLRDNLSGGRPLLWWVNLGYVKEDPEFPRAEGEYLRIIIGYDKKSNDVIYSDSLGEGHEKKKMGVGSAFAITSGLLLIEPR